MNKKNKEHIHFDSSKTHHREQAVEIVNQQISEATKELQHQLLAQSMPNPLQTEEQRAAKCQHDAQQVFDALRIDIKRGIECYAQYTLPVEKEKLSALFNKIFDYMEIFGRKETPPALTDKDIAPLDIIATRTFAEEHYKEASCMWRFILQLQPTNSRAWVGWAIAEQMNHHTEIVEHIYRLGRELLPHDIYLALFAADFYLSENKADISREIIHKTFDTLKEIEGINPEAFDVLNQKLADIEQFTKDLISLGR